MTKLNLLSRHWIKTVVLDYEKQVTRKKKDSTGKFTQYLILNKELMLWTGLIPV
jgi:hypothetical protein